jgi:hypothetical protein
VRPLVHDDTSTEASHAFNSVPTFPGIDFGCGCLLSFCFYGLLKTQGLPPAPRPYGNRRSVLAWSGWFRHLTYATSCRTNGLQTAARGLANKGRFRLTFGANKDHHQPTVAANEPTFIATSSQTAPWTHIRCIQSPEARTVRKKLDLSLIRTHSVRFIGGYPDINDW